MTLRQFERWKQVFTHNKYYVTLLDIIYHIFQIWFPCFPDSVLNKYGREWSAWIFISTLLEYLYSCRLQSLPTVREIFGLHCRFFFFAWTDGQNCVKCAGKCKKTAKKAGFSSIFVKMCRFCRISEKMRGFFQSVPWSTFASLMVCIYNK